MDEQPRELHNAETSPPLSIVHLLAWTGITAIALAIQQNLSDDRGQLVRFELFNRTWFAAMYGVSLGTVVLMMVRRQRGVAFPSQPGEYYLAASGFGSTIQLVCWGLYRYLFEPVASAGLWLFYLSHLLMLIPDFWAAIRVTTPGWRGLMWARLGFDAVQPMMISSRFDSGELSAYWVVVGIEVVVTIVWLPVLLVSDRKQRIHRGWLHGVGAICWLLACLHVVAWFCWMYFGD